MEHDIEKIKQSIEVLKPGKQLYEIRILIGNGKRKTTISGLFKGTKNIEKAFKSVDLRRANVFISLNAVNNQCYSMEQHERFVQTDTTISDSDITEYKWFLVDLDPKRKSGISATDEELEFAKAKADQVKRFLSEVGFTNPIEAQSGNGYHLLYQINMENNEENEALYKSALHAVSDLFSDDKVDVDKSVFNPARVSKLYGTVARKGADTEERPHRLSKIINVPDKISATELAAIERLATYAPPEQEPPKRIQRKGDFDVETWLSDHGVGVYRTTSTPDGATKYILEECPFDHSHKAPDSMVIVQPGGAIGFRCLHNSCMGRTWQDLRLMYEPDAYDDKWTHDDARIEEGWKKHKTYMITRETDDVEEVKRSIPKLVTISAGELQQKEFAETYYAVENMIPEGETIIAAPPKTGKSWLMLDMCLRVSNGEPFLGFDTRKSDTLYLALEDGDKFEQERLNIVAPDGAPDNFYFIFQDVLHLNEGFLLQLDEIFERHPEIKLVVIDTLNFVQYHAAKGESAYNCDYRTGRDLKAYAEKRGIAIVVVTHTTKMIHAEDEMMNVSGTNGVTGAADAVVVLSKERRTDLDAKMFITGRKVRQSMHEIKFNDVSCMWEYKGIAEIGDKDTRERAEREKRFYNSKIRDAVLTLAMNTEEDGFWCGRAGKIIEDAAKHDIGLRESNKEIGGFLTQMQGMFMDVDGILVEKIKNGTGAATYKIYHPKTVFDENFDDINGGG